MRINTYYNKYDFSGSDNFLAIWKNGKIVFNNKIQDKLNFSDSNSGIDKLFNFKEHSYIDINQSSALQFWSAETPWVTSPIVGAEYSFSIINNRYRFIDSSVYCELDLTPSIKSTYILNPGGSLYDLKRFNIAPDKYELSEVRYDQSSEDGHKAEYGNLEPDTIGIKYQYKADNYTNPCYLSFYTKNNAINANNMYIDFNYGRDFYGRSIETRFDNLDSSVQGSIGKKIKTDSYSLNRFYEISELNLSTNYFVISIDDSNNLNILLPSKAKFSDFESYIDGSESNQNCGGTFICNNKNSYKNFGICYNGLNDYGAGESENSVKVLGFDNNANGEFDVLLGIRNKTSGSNRPAYDGVYNSNGNLFETKYGGARLIGKTTKRSVQLFGKADSNEVVIFDSNERITTDDSGIPGIYPSFNAVTYTHKVNRGNSGVNDPGPPSLDNDICDKVSLDSHTRKYQLERYVDNPVNQSLNTFIVLTESLISSDSPNIYNVTYDGSGSDFYFNINNTSIEDGYSTEILFQHNGSFAISVSLSFDNNPASIYYYGSGMLTGNDTLSPGESMIISIMFAGNVYYIMDAKKDSLV